jgi:hypothetical protein
MSRFSEESIIPTRRTSWPSGSLDGTVKLWRPPYAPAPPRPSVRPLTDAFLLWMRYIDPLAPGDWGFRMVE